MICTVYEYCVHCINTSVSSSKATSRRSRQESRKTSSTWEAIVRQDTRNGLSRDRIVAAGIAVADRDGLSAVSIRRIAAQLNASPMALYYYVPSKRDLLNLILDAL